MFAENCKTIRASWWVRIGSPIFNSKADRSVWSDSDVLCFIQGQIDKDVLSYSKSNTIQVRSALGA